MTIEEVKEIIEKKIQDLETRKLMAFKAGDLEEYDRLSTELQDTKKTLEFFGK
ncbi:MAG: hypothetical protein WCJ84_00375 [Candidatus Peregrinibacteria bacterium]